MAADSLQRFGAHDFVPVLPVFEEIPDSGTETDDEEEENALDMEYSEQGQNSSPTRNSSSSSSSSSSSPRTGGHPRPSSTPVGAMSALDIRESAGNKENIQPREFAAFATPTGPAHSDTAAPTVQIDLFGDNPNDGNHSSEEELEEINKFEPSGAVGPHSLGGGVTPTSETSTPTPVLLRNCDTPSITNGQMTPLGAGVNGANSSSSSSDEAMNTAPLERGPIQDPVEFSTSPPLHVHKPRRSSSPPSKMFLMETNEHLHQLASDTSAFTVPGSLAFQRQQVAPPEEGSRRDRRRTISPRKRCRQSRTQHMQRPCLDFEKMQQLKTRSVTSWRHGGELSLFCW